MDTNVRTDGLKTIRFDRNARGERATPKTTKLEWYKDPTGAFRTGLWTGEPSRVEIDYPVDEVCVLLEGVVRLTDSSGHVETYRAGDTFLIPRGFRGVWETVEPVRKFYAVHEPRKE